MPPLPRVGYKMNIDSNARLEKARQQQGRARERQIAKMKDPEYREKRLEKARKTAISSAEKRRAKLADPAYIAAQMEKKREALKRSRDKAVAGGKDKKTSPPAKKTKASPSRERSKTSDEKVLWDELGQIGCIACLQHGKERLHVSIHHIDGRTKPDCHKRVIPLCDFHHDTAAPAEARRDYPWLTPRHAKGTIGGRAEFERLNAPEHDLLVIAYTMIGRRDEALKLLAL